MPRIEIIGLEGVPEIKPGDDLARIIVEAAERNGVKIEDGDVIVVKSKIVSKAEGKIVDLKRVKPSERARKIAEATGKDPRLVELVLKESAEVVKAVKGHLIVKTRHGIVCANAGIDRSNVAGSRDIVLLLPEDPDASARRLREEIRRLTGKKVAIVITDTYGRPLRNGQVDMAIGLCGMKPFRDYRGQPDMKGYILRVKRIAVADEVAAASELVTGNGAEGIPVAVIKGLNFVEGEEPAKLLNMPKEKWLFR
ncbi:MAG: coenzyme F420-0:L-glutamate ligase [Thermoprotei archaeon]|nr:MAG: coenzyme F420-0:L-glutamate ligase [Thermoprotei archaeon]